MGITVEAEMGFGEVILNLVRFRMWWMLALMLAVTCGLAVLSAGPYYVGSKLVSNCLSLHHLNLHGL